jgi:uncharacterized protein YdhG (YjbR/CyaY superfamily)
MKTKQKSGRSASTSKKPAASFTAEERAAARARVQEMKAGQADGESAALAAIAGMSGHDRTMGKRLHELIKASAPELSPKTWYGMPAYARDGKVICHFQSAAKFKTRYATLGFSDQAKLDDGGMWPVAYALKELTSVEERTVAALLKRALA